MGAMALYHNPYAFGAALSRSSILPGEPIML